MPSTGEAETIDADGIAVRLSSPDREMFPGITKREVMAYYLAIAPVLLPQIAGRPTALERWTDGVSERAESFFQKHLPKKVPDYVHGVGVRFPSGRPGTLLDPDSAAGIAWAVQMNTITFHPWPVTGPDVTHPDQLRIDLDPSPGRGFDDVRTAASLCAEVLGELGWPSFVKTSGSRGLHIFVPIVPSGTFVDVRHAVIAIGRELERRAPDLITMSWWKEERGERIFVDFNQNAQDRVMASAYSLRPRPHAPVSMPIAWSDVADVDPGAFTLRTVPGIVATRTDPWAGMRAAAVTIDAALAWWDRDVAEGLPELPYPPDFPKMPGEPPRVQPSRKRSDEEPPSRRQGHIRIDPSTGRAETADPIVEAPAPAIGGPSRLIDSAYNGPLAPQVRQVLAAHPTCRRLGSHGPLPSSPDTNGPGILYVLHEDALEIHVVVAESLTAAIAHLEDPAIEGSMSRAAAFWAPGSRDAVVAASPALTKLTKAGKVGAPVRVTSRGDWAKVPPGAGVYRIYFYGPDGKTIESVYVGRSNNFHSRPYSHDHIPRNPDGSQKWGGPGGVAKIALIYAKSGNQPGVWSSVDLDKLEVYHVAKMRRRYEENPRKHPRPQNVKAGGNGPPSLPRDPHFYNWACGE